jgi:hypothetical protein
MRIWETLYNKRLYPVKSTSWTCGHGKVVGILPLV